MSSLKSSAAVNNAIKPAIVRQGEVVSKPEPVTQVAPELKKRTCPFTLAQFLAVAQAMPGMLGTQAITLDPKQFSTGSFGFGFNGKVNVIIDGKPVTMQVGVNATVVGSKEAAR